MLAFPRNWSSTFVLSATYKRFSRKISSKAPSISYNFLIPKSLTQASCSRLHMNIPWAPHQINLSKQNLSRLPEPALLDLSAPHQAKSITESGLTPPCPLRHPLRHVPSVCSPHWRSPHPGLYTALLDDYTSLLCGLSAPNFSLHSRTCSAMGNMDLGSFGCPFPS